MVDSGRCPVNGSADGFQSPLTRKTASRSSKDGQARTAIAWAMTLASLSSAPASRASTYGERQHVRARAPDDAVDLDAIGTIL
jgi:hypothetical protein